MLHKQYPEQKNIQSLEHFNPSFWTLCSVSFSQAESKGISVDDELVSINGESAIEMGLPAVEKLLKKSGSSVTLTLIG